jgi:hypothetical protein
MQTVVETPAYVSAAKAAQMTTAEQDAAITMVADKPESGNVLQGTGGVRKARLAGRGKGKSGGYRLVWWFGGTDIPVFLLTVFGKG